MPFIFKAPGIYVSDSIPINLFCGAAKMIKNLLTYFKTPQGSYLRAMFIQRVIGICLFLVGTGWKIPWHIIFYFVIYLLGTALSYLCFFQGLLSLTMALKIGIPVPLGKRRVLLSLQIWLGCFVLYFIAGLEMHSALPLRSAAIYWGGMILVVLSSILSLYCTRADFQRKKGVLAIGPYKLVRFPHYLSQVLWLVGTMLVFAMPWTSGVIFADIILLVILTELEDRAMKEAVEYYPSYASQVRKKLFPMIW